MNHDATNTTPDLTPTFNEAVGGPESNAAPVESGGPDTLNGGAAERIEATQDFHAAANASNMQAPVASPPLADREPNEAPADDKPDPIAQAQAELEQLKAERPRPDAELHHRPDEKQLIQIVHTEVERNRENRIAALECYLEFQQSDLRQEAEYRQDEGLEFAM